MKNKLALGLVLLVLPLLACVAVTSLFSSQNNPQVMTGSIAVKGEGVMLPCSDPSLGIGCTGKTSVFVLPSPDDFAIALDGNGNITSGQVKLTMEVDENYDITEPGATGCGAKVLGESTSEFTGMIPLAPQNGPPVTSAIFYGPLASRGAAQSPWQCLGAAGNPSGSAQTQSNVTLELEGFSSSMAKGSQGTCVFSVLPSFSSYLANFSSTCTYQIEDVAALIRPGSTSAP